MYFSRTVHLSLFNFYRINLIFKYRYFCEQDNETGMFDGLAFCVSKIRGRDESQIT